jgi:hypothetical protein
MFEQSAMEYWIQRPEFRLSSPNTLSAFFGTEPTSAQTEKHTGRTGRIEDLRRLPLLIADHVDNLAMIMSHSDILGNLSYPVQAHSIEEPLKILSEFFRCH